MATCWVGVKWCGFDRGEAPLREECGPTAAVSGSIVLFPSSHMEAHFWDAIYSPRGGWFTSLVRFLAWCYLIVTFVGFAMLVCLLMTLLADPATLGPHMNASLGDELVVAIAYGVRVFVTQVLGVLLLDLRASKAYHEQYLTWRSNRGGLMKNGLVLIPFLITAFGLPSRLPNRHTSMVGTILGKATAVFVQLLIVWSTIPFYLFLHLASAEVEQVKKVIRDIQEGASSSQIPDLQRDYLALCQSLRRRCLKLDNLSALVLLDVFLSGSVTLVSLALQQQGANNSYLSPFSVDLVFDPIPPLLLYALVISWRCDSLASDAQRLALKLSVERRQSFIGRPEHVNELLNFIQLVRAMPTGWFAFGIRVNSSLTAKAIGPTAVATLKKAWNYVHSPGAERVVPPVAAVAIAIAAAFVCWLLWKAKMVEAERPHHIAAPITELSSEHLSAT